MGSRNLPLAVKLKLSAVLASGLFCFASAPAAEAETTVPINQTVTFSMAENGQASCREGTNSVSCNNFLGTTAATPSTREVETSSRISNLNSIGYLGLPIYATSSVYNDFVVPGPPDGDMVDAQITVHYDFTGNIAGAGIYAMSNSLALRVQDRTLNALVARQELQSMERQGDQGVTDVSGAQERRVLTGEVGHMVVKLRRGHHYRLHFELESSAVTFIVGVMRADASAKWSRLSVNVGEDMVELLSIHDQQVKAALLGVQSTLLGAISQHDKDIKAELATIKGQLTGIEKDLDEIKTLLLTPQGLRDGFPINPNNPKSNTTSTPSATTTTKGKSKK